MRGLPRLRREPGSLDERPLILAHMAQIGDFGRVRFGGLALGLLLGTWRPAIAAPTEAECAADKTLAGCGSAKTAEAAPSKEACLSDSTLPGCDVYKTVDPETNSFCKKNPDYFKCKGAGKVREKPPLVPDSKVKPHPGPATLGAPAEIPPPENPGENPDDANVGASPSGDGPPGSMNGEAQREALDRSGARALRSAGQGSDFFNSQARAAESMAGGGPAGGRAAGNPAGSGRGGGSSGKAGSALGGAMSGDPANPKSSGDLFAASAGGFRGSFAALGLKTGRSPSGAPAILRADGALASPSELAGLRARIQSEPAALMQRPDFFNVISRERFNSLKTSYAIRPDLGATAFKHIAMTPEQRDFTRSESCTVLSGKCNPYTRQLSYRKGEYVSPEELDEIETKIPSLSAEGKPGSENDSGESGGDDGGRNHMTDGRLSALIGRFHAMIGDLWGSGGASAGAGEAAQGGQESDENGWRGKKEVVAFSKLERRSSTALPFPDRSGAQAGWRRRVRGLILWPALAAVLGFGWVFVTRRRRKKESGRDVD